MFGIEEHFFTRKAGYATTLVDLKNHKVFDVVRLVNQHFMSI